MPIYRVSNFVPPYHTTANFLLDPNDVGGPLKEDVDVNIKDESGANPIHHASRAGELECLTFLIDHDATIEAVAYGGQRSIHMAANFMRESCLIKLIESGADTNALDDYGNSAAIFAFARGVFANCRILLEAGCDAGHKNAAGATVSLYVYPQPCFPHNSKPDAHDALSLQCLAPHTRVRPPPPLSHPPAPLAVSPQVCP